MDITLLVQSIVGLVVILGILLFLFLYLNADKKNKAKKKEAEAERKKLSQSASSSKSYRLEDLLAVIRNKHATTEELSEALEKIIKYYGHIHPKLGLRPHPDFDIYAEILLRICRHPHTNKDIIIQFDRALEKLNPSYIKEINDTLTKGLNSRGI